MKSTLKFMITVCALALTTTGKAQTTASANCFATIISIHDTAKLDHAHGAGKSGAREAKLTTRVLANGASAQAVAIKGDFIYLNAFGRKRKVTKTTYSTAIID